MKQIHISEATIMKVLFFLMLMCLTVMGAFAQSQVTENNFVDQSTLIVNLPDLNIQA